MVRHVTTRYPTTKIICIGFSMGGNIVTKYLGEKKSIPQIIAGISACQVVINQCYKLVHPKITISILTTKAHYFLLIGI